MDFSELRPEDTQVDGDQPNRPDPPAQVAGRVLHIDADFLAYQHGYRWESEPLTTSMRFVEKSAETLRIMAGAEKALLYVTCGAKAGRHKYARVAEYQAKRSERPEGLDIRVAELRQFMGQLKTPTLSGCEQYEVEADDAICTAMYAGSKADQPHLHVMWSLDKDLYMVGGLHLDKEWELVAYPWGYGSCELVEVGSSKKVVGSGTSFFWHQILMGDSADNIPGLPKLGRDSVLKYLQHPAYLTKAYGRVANTNAQKAAKRKAIEQAEAKIKSKACGPVAAYEVLKRARNDQQAFRIVKECYLDWYGPLVSFEAWDGQQEDVTVGDMIIEQARLLWLQRTPGEDVITFFREIANG